MSPHLSAAPSSVTSNLPPTRVHIGMLSTYPPELCGLATFAAALERALVDQRHRVDVVAIVDELHPTPRAVTAELRNGDPASVRAAAAALSRTDVAIVQHEYGIFGGPDGDEVLDLLDLVEVPTIVVLHTVPSAPTVRQRSVLEAIAARASRLVVMSATAGTRLAQGYRIDEDLVVSIPHGAATPTDGSPTDHDRGVGARGIRLLTWGLLGPGKGVEHVIDALAALAPLGVRPHYTVAGVTHPKVLAREGDRYRTSLIQRTFATGTAGTVSFDDTYRDVASLTRFVAGASVVVLPYDSREQVTSGVLVDAIAAGRPVIATAFPHAVELLAGGAGIVVPHEDPAAMARAIRSVVTDRRVLADMGEAARRLAPELSWPAVAGRYARLAADLVRMAEPVRG